MSRGGEEARGEEARGAQAACAGGMLAPEREAHSDPESSPTRCEPPDKAEVWSGEGAGIVGRVKLEVEVEVEPVEQHPAMHLTTPLTLKCEPELDRSIADEELWCGGGAEQAAVKVEIEIEIQPLAEQPLGTTNIAESSDCNLDLDTGDQRTTRMLEEPEDDKASQVGPPECSDRGDTSKSCNEIVKKKFNRVNRGSVESKSAKNMCAECGKRFRKLSLLIIHMRSHTGEKPYKCTECGKCFSSSGNLCTHKHTHTGARPHECADCHKTFTQSSNLRKHIGRTHTKERRFECTACHKKFDFLCLLRAHMRNHTGERPYKCSECDETFLNLNTMRKHRKTHTGIKSFQ